MKGMSGACKTPAVKARLEAYRKNKCSLEAITVKQNQAFMRRAKLRNAKNIKVHERRQHAILVRERKANANTNAAMRALRDDRRLFTALRRHAQTMTQKVTKVKQYNREVSQKKFQAELNSEI